ncbi:PorP/SprF family type IX secretion system membrane protein [uncultured Draconibacterium sp.]|uniref:PorP/SprF family type IX secretion system membrane protein n=1 Tax=uncultured Draconibacterium sp. TaxID=1573823 RepID=UPI0025D5C62D|nr:PorP/SprF family type IX secretion system membrane protein [uncultured Draconibacterium sp.]
MTNVKNIIFTIVLASFWLSTFSQDVTFSQFYANPVYMNPAFSGTSGVPRVAIQYRNQWHGFSNAYNSYSFAVDIPVKKLRGGIGLNFLNDVQASGALSVLSINAAYSVGVQLNENMWMNGGLQVGYVRNSLNVNDLIFADNLDSNFGNHGTSGELNYLSSPNNSYLDYGIGSLVFSKRIFMGVAVHHLTEPTQSFSDDDNYGEPVKRKFSAHMGARLPVYLHGHQRKKMDISPQLILQSQGAFQQVNYGLYAARKGIALGTWFRQNFGLRYDAVIFVIGFVRNRIQLTYSYDLTVSGLSGASGGTSEVSCTFLLKQHKNIRTLPFFDRYDEEFGEM